MIDQAVASPSGVRVESDCYPVRVISKDPLLRESTSAAADWVTRNRPLLDQMLLNFGVLFFRGFALHSAADFAQFLSAYPPLATGYRGGTSERKAVTGNVMEATQAPPEREILLHQEMAYTRDFPRRLAFFCELAPKTGGQTLVGDVRRFTKIVDPNLFQEIRRRGLRYERFFRNPDCITGHAGLDVLHRTWQAAFGTDDRALAETACRQSGSECKWLNEGMLATFVSPGWTTHPVTGEELWFNQLPSYDMNRLSVGDVYYPLYQEHYGSRRRWPMRITFGDGEEIASDVMLKLAELWARVQAAPDWEAGDVMLLDNILTAHGRATFTGERTVRVMLLE